MHAEPERNVWNIPLKDIWVSLLEKKEDDGDPELFLWLCIHYETGVTSIYSCANPVQELFLLYLQPQTTGMW